MSDNDDVLNFELKQKVITAPVLYHTSGLLLPDHILKRRKPNTVGFVHGIVAGHGGDVWWINHSDTPDEPFNVNLVAPYYTHEFSPLLKHSLINNLKHLFFFSFENPLNKL